MDEMRESVRIVRQCLDRLDEMDGEPWVADDRKVVLPPRHELHTSMESLIHHFKIVTEGFTVPEGEVYVVIESPRGEAGCYLVSDGGARPWRVHFRAPSLAALQATATVVQGVPRRRPHRGRRLARSRDGRRGPLMTSVSTRIEKLRKQYPRVDIGRPAGAPSRAGGARRLAATRGATGGRGCARPDSRLLPLDRVFLRPAPPRAGRPNARRGVHERLLRALGCAAGRGGVRARARARSGDDSGRRLVHARNRRVPRRLRLGDRGRDRQPAPTARAGGRRARRSSRSCVR